MRSLLNCRVSGFVQSRSKGRLSGKSSYGKMPFPDSKSTAWEFFTDHSRAAPCDGMLRTTQLMAPPFAKLMVSAFKTRVLNSSRFSSMTCSAAASQLRIRASIS